MRGTARALPRDRGIWTTNKQARRRPVDAMQSKSTEQPPPQPRADVSKVALKGRQSAEWHRLPRYSVHSVSYAIYFYAVSKFKDVIWKLCQRRRSSGILAENTCIAG